MHVIVEVGQVLWRLGSFGAAPASLSAFSAGCILWNYWRLTERHGRETRNFLYHTQLSRELDTILQAHSN